MPPLCRSHLMSFPHGAFTAELLRCLGSDDDEDTDLPVFEGPRYQAAEAATVSNITAGFHCSHRVPDESVGRRFFSASQPITASRRDSGLPR